MFWASDTCIPRMIYKERKKQGNNKKRTSKQTTKIKNKKKTETNKKTASKNTHCHPGRKNLQSVHHQFVRSKDSRHGAAQLDATAEHGIGLGSHVTQQKHMENGKKQYESFQSPHKKKHDLQLESSNEHQNPKWWILFRTVIYHIS